MTKKQKLLRLDEDLVAKVAELKHDKETDASLYERVIVAGYEVIQGDLSPDKGTEATVAPADLVAALNASITRLEHINATLEAQLAVKDEQIANLTNLTTQAHQLNAMQQVKQLPERAGLVSRLASLFTGKKK